MPDDERTTIHLRIITPDRTLFDEPVEMFSVTGMTGVFDIEPGHEPLVAPLAIGRAGVRRAGEETMTPLAIHGGFLEIDEERATILANAAEVDTEIDIERARQAEEQARRDLDERRDDPDVDPERTQQALLRAINRIRTVENGAV